MKKRKKRVIEINIARYPEIKYISPGKMRFKYKINNKKPNIILSIISLFMSCNKLLFLY
jgi:hypothetical protein